VENLWQKFKEVTISILSRAKQDKYLWSQFSPKLQRDLWHLTRSNHLLRFMRSNYFSRLWLIAVQSI